MKTSDFDFDFPRELIAHKPLAQRDHSRLMVLDRAQKSIKHCLFYEIADYLGPGDLLVLNNTKVIPANLKGEKVGGGAKIEVLLATLKLPFDGKKQVWECLVRPGKRLKVGSQIVFGRGEVVGKVLEKTDSGEQIIEFEGDLAAYMENFGEIPLPPYIKTEPRSQKQLSKRYQTVYAKQPGASASPTAGLHFTQNLLKRAKSKGVEVAFVTLHTGLATFKPVYSEEIEKHKMYSEYFEVPEETIEALKKAKRVVAVGTTVVRTLETIGKRPLPSAGMISGFTDLFIYPGYQFRVVGAMITNFHWPRSTLLMLVSAFAGRDFVMAAYQEAIRQRYRLFSFGDAMLIL